MRGIHRSPVNSPHKGQWRGALMLSLICAWINGWVNKREAGDLKRHRAHCDATVMYCLIPVDVFFNTFRFTSVALTKSMAPMPMKQPWRIWLIILFRKKIDYTITKKSYTTKLCACFHDVLHDPGDRRHIQNGPHFADIFKNIFSYENPWILRFHRRLFCSVEFTLYQHWFRYWLDAARQQAIIWTNGGLIYWRLYVLRGPSEL